MGKDGGNDKVQPRLAPVMHRYLEDLAKLGPYGDSPTEAAKRLIELGVMDALAKKLIPSRGNRKRR